jgi:hypothetical protein
MLVAPKLFWLRLIPSLRNKLEKIRTAVLTQRVIYIHVRHGVEWNMSIKKFQITSSAYKEWCMKYTGQYSLRFGVRSLIKFSELYSSHILGVYSSQELEY